MNMTKKDIHFQDIHSPYFISGKRAKARNKAVSKLVDDGLEHGCNVNPMYWFGSSQDSLDYLMELLEIRKEQQVRKESGHA
jgi:hypothetical protein